MARSIYEPLPEMVIERSANIIDLSATDSQDESRKEELKEFVGAWVPKDDRDEVDGEVS